MWFKSGVHRTLGEQHDATLRFSAFHDPIHVVWHSLIHSVLVEEQILFGCAILVVSDRPCGKHTVCVLATIRGPG